MKVRPSQAISRTSPPPSPLQARVTEDSGVRQMMQKMERLEHGSEHGGGGHTGHNRWMVPYADLLTLLLGLFLVLFTSSQKPETHHADAKTEPQTAINTLAYAGQQAVPSAENANQTPASASQIAAQNRAIQQIKNDSYLARQLTQRIHQRLPNIQGIEVHQQMRGVVISMKDTILFTPGNADLNPAAQQTLNHLIQQLHTALGGKPRPIRVEGHTDNTPIANGKFPSNWELSTARATAVVRALAASHHFPPQTLSVAGYGEFKPLKDNSSIKGKQKNRRVDIVVLRPDMGEDMSPDLTENSPQTSPKSLSKTPSNSIDPDAPNAPDFQGPAE